MTLAKYLDFELEIGLGRGRSYPLAVLNSPGGEARAQMLFPFDELALESHLKDLQIALLRSGGNRRLALSREEKTVQDFGKALFEALMSGEIRSRYDVSQREAAQRGLGLRLKLRVLPPELASLPWEFLYDSHRSEYLCLSTQTPLVRYLELPQVIQPLEITPPLRILGITASPRDLPALDIENEKQRVERALEGLTAQGQVKIDWLDHATRRSLQRALRPGHGGPWHIFHFIGHGGFDPAADEGFLVFEKETGESDRLPATLLARLLADHPSLRLAFLNSCESAQGGKTDIFSSAASLLVRRGLPAALAMQYEITDRAAIEFARGFYEALADYLPVDAATAEARKAVSLEVNNTIEWGTPALFMRAPDGVLFKKTGLQAEKNVLPQAETPARDQKPQPPLSDEELAEAAYRQTLKELADKEAEIRREAIVRVAQERARREAAARSRTLELGGGVMMEFVRVPAGKFWMGSDKALDAHAFPYELPQHEVFLDEYLIGKAPVTNQQYQVFVRGAGHRAPAGWKKGTYPAKLANHPVVNVSWQDAQAFCQWASQLIGQTVRLPSEAEWEKAARGDQDKRLYPWGNQPPDGQRCNFGGREGGATAVGRYSPRGDSPYGCVDMAGNVWEWVADWYDDGYYSTSPASNPSGPARGDGRVMRGGSWSNYEYYLRVSLRFRDTPDDSDSIVGFRCARSR